MPCAQHGAFLCCGWRRWPPAWGMARDYQLTTIKMSLFHNISCFSHRTLDGSIIFRHISKTFVPFAAFVFVTTFCASESLLCFPVCHIKRWVRENHRLLSSHGLLGFDTVW
jgi:hypothetical protein